MSDLKSMLERVGGSVTPRNDAFERLTNQRTHRRRTRRITAGVLALLVAAAGALATYAALSPGSVRPTGDQDQGIPALWPEHTRSALEAAQARADDGQDAWRLDATATAQHFARDVLGWPDAIATSCPIRSVCGVTEGIRIISKTGARSDLGVVLDQLLGRGRIWSVVRIGDAGEDLPASFELPPGIEANHPENALDPGDDVAGGQTVWLRSSLAGSDATTPTVAMGYVYFDPCGTQSFGVPVQRKSVFWTTQVATRDLQPPCGNGQETTGPVGEHLTHAVDGLLLAVASPDPSIDAAVVGLQLFGDTRTTEQLPEITAIAAIPVHFVPGSTDHSFAGLSGRVAFSTVGRSKGDIYSVNPDGTELMQLTSSPWADYSPSWSPGKDRIAFVTNTEETDADIFVMNSDGSGVQQLTRGPDTDGQPTWSPDGSQIAFFRTDPKGVTEILLVGPGGSNLRQLTENNSLDAQPDWSPDGRTIVVTRNERGHSEIYAIDVAQGTETRLTDGSGGFGDPAWSPDGSQIAFSKDLDDNGLAEIIVMDLADGKTTTVMEDVGSVIAQIGWTPDARGLVLSAVTVADGSRPETALFQVLDLETGTTRSIPIDAGGSTADW